MQFLLILLLPVLTICFLPLKKYSRNLFYMVLMIVSLTHILLSVTLPLNATFEISYLNLFFNVDKYTRLFIILVGVAWFISIIYTTEFTKYHFQDKTKKFFFLLNSLMTIVLFNAAAGNLQTLFLFYVLGIPFTYFLLKIRGNHKSKVGAKIFLKQTLYPSVFILLPAIVLTYYFIGNTSFSGSKTFLTENVNPYIGGFILFLFILGLSKNATFPFHNWLPRTFSAPAPVSGLVHSVATVKTASIAMIKIAVYIFDVNYIRTLTTDFFTGGFLIYLCGLTAVYTAYKALKTNDLKQRFTLSTVGQLSYILLAVLVGTPIGILAATLHIVTHSIAKSCLFYVAGFFNSFYNTTNAGVVSKLMPSYKFIAVVVAICGLSITGFPFLAGFYSKDLMLLEEYHTGNYASALFLLTGSIINIFYIYPVVRAAFKKPDVTLERKPIPFAMKAAFVISIVLILTANFYMTYITSMID